MVFSQKKVTILPFSLEPLSYSERNMKRLNTENESEYHKSFFVLIFGKYFDFFTSSFDIQIPYGYY